MIPTVDVCENVEDSCFAKDNNMPARCRGTLSSGVMVSRVMSADFPTISLHPLASSVNLDTVRAPAGKKVAALI